MVYQFKLEIISTVMNFLFILQVKLSFMFARGVTSNACSVKRKGRRVFQGHPTTKFYQIHQMCPKWVSLCFKSLFP